MPTFPWNIFRTNTILCYHNAISFIQQRFTGVSETVERDEWLREKYGDKIKISLSGTQLQKKKKTLVLLPDWQTARLFTLSIRIPYTDVYFTSYITVYHAEPRRIIGLDTGPVEKRGHARLPRSHISTDERSV